ncbi:hypothetical protein NQZ68_022847 [Dissostichus eleginoides]|nr:hypothetical protein NQZ68_022847 [Dissostichus eleginoides]
MRCSVAPAAAPPPRLCVVYRQKPGKQPRAVCVLSSGVTGQGGFIKRTAPPRSSTGQTGRGRCVVQLEQLELLL